MSAVFRRLHEGPDVLLLPNCWDAGSAKCMERIGARAIATTSAGVAWSHGYSDGNVLPRECLLFTVRAIARVIEVPLSIDVEAGYSDDPHAVADLVLAVIDAGAVGINLEDGFGSAALLAAKIEAVKRAAAHAGVDVFVNARTDVYLKGLVPEPDRIREAISRSHIYREAGADGIFVPKVSSASEIRELASEVRVPLNVLAWPGVPPAAELAALGARRLSAGSAIAQSAWQRASELGDAFVRKGRSDSLTERATPYAEINSLFGTTP